MARAFLLSPRSVAYRAGKPLTVDLRSAYGDFSRRSERWGNYRPGEFEQILVMAEGNVEREILERAHSYVVCLGIPKISIRPDIGRCERNNRTVERLFRSPIVRLGWFTCLLRSDFLHQPYR